MVDSMGGILVETQPPRVSLSFEEKKSRRRVLLLLIAIFSFSFLLSGMVAGLVLIKEQQDRRGKAFTGYIVTGGGKTSDVTDVLRYARQGDIPQRGDLVSEESVRGIFYQLAKQFGSIWHLEYQKVADPTLLLQGKVFLFYDEALNKTYIFSRIENMPAVVGKVNRLWLQSSFEDRSFPLSVSQTIAEDNISVTYTVFVGDGDLRQEGRSIAYSYDTASTVKPKNPESIILSVKF